MNRFAFWWLMNITVRFERRRLRKLWSALLLLFVSSRAEAETVRTTVPLNWVNQPRKGDITVSQVASTRYAVVKFERDVGGGSSDDRFTLLFKDGAACQVFTSSVAPLSLVCATSNVMLRLFRFSDKPLELELVEEVPAPSGKTENR